MACPSNLKGLHVASAPQRVDRPLHIKPTGRSGPSPTKQPVAREEVSISPATLNRGLPRLRTNLPSGYPPAESAPLAATRQLRVMPVL